MLLELLVLFLSLLSSLCGPCNYSIDSSLAPSLTTFTSLTTFSEAFNTNIEEGNTTLCDNITIFLTNNQIYPMNSSIALHYALGTAIPVFFTNYTNETETVPFPIIQFQSSGIGFNNFSSLSLSNLAMDITGCDLRDSNLINLFNSSVTYENLTIFSENWSPIDIGQLTVIWDGNLTLQNVNVSTIQIRGPATQLFSIFQSNFTINNFLLEFSIFPDNFSLFYMNPQSFSIDGLSIVSNYFSNNSLVITSEKPSLNFNLNNFNFINNTAFNFGFYWFQTAEATTEGQGYYNISNSNISSNIMTYSISTTQSSILTFLPLSYISFLTNITISDNLISYGTLFRFTESFGKISQVINLTNINFINNFHYYPLVWIDTTQTGVLHNVSFYQDSHFIDNFLNNRTETFFQINGPTQTTGGCILIDNVQNVNLSKITIQNYLSYNQPLIKVSYDSKLGIVFNAAADEVLKLSLNMSECAITNSTMITNPINLGSILYISLAVPGNVNIDRCFFNNSIFYAASLAQQTGIAINMDAQMANLQITKSHFEYNISPLKSVISVDVNLLSILDSRFRNNTSINSPVTLHRIHSIMRKFKVNQTISFSNQYLTSGMALYIQAVNAIIDRCNFTNNDASNGGAIYVRSIEGGNLTISNSNFNDNMAYSVGGAIVISNYMEAQSNTFINNCFFSGNQASSQGGSITFQALSGSNLTVSNSTFTNGSAGYGNYFYLEHMLSWVTIINSSFIENDPIPNTMRGGSISINSGEGANVMTVGCQFINITSGISTGTEASIVTVSQGSYIDNSSLFSNITYGANGVIFVSGSTSLYASNFDSCSVNMMIGIVGNVGIVLLDFQSNISIFQAIFFNNNHLNSQSSFNPVLTSILMKASSSIFMYKSNFTSNVGFNGSCILALEGSFLNSSNSLIMQNYFINNSAQNGGGAIYIFSGNFDLYENQFFSNQAFEGGAIMYNDNFLTNYSILISDNKFINNTATKSGGAIAINSQLPSKLSEFMELNFFANNSCSITDNAYGVNISLFSSNISLTEVVYNNSNYTLIQLSQNNFSLMTTALINTTTNSTIYFISNQTMATLYNFSFVITLLDALNEPVTIDNQSQIHLTISLTNPNQTAPVISPTNSSPAIYSNVSLNSNSKATASNGIVNYKTINITSTPNTNITLNFSLNNINNYYQSFFIVLAYFRTCIPGEILALNDNTTYCYECPAGSFSFSNNSQACEVCPENGYCRGGSFYQVPHGYWRYYLNSNLTRCLNPLACQGDNFTDENLAGNDLCSPGYIGGVCGGCDITQNYMKTGQTTCSECLSIDYTILLLGVWILLYFGFTLFSIVQTIDANKDFIVTLEEERDQFEKAGFYLKILTNYIQVLTLLKNFALQIPAPLDLSSHASDPIYAIFPSFGCLTGKFFSHRAYYFEVLVSTIIFPVFEILFVSMIWLIAIKLKRFPSLNRENLVLAIFFILSFSQVLCVNDLMGFSICSSYDNVDYVFSNLAVYCDDDYQFFRWLYLVPMLIVWMILFPCGIWFVLYINKDQMMKPSWRGRLGFFYNSYKDEYYYWEFVKMILKSAIAALSLWTGLDIKTRIMTSIFVLMVMGLETYRIQPSRNTKINEIDVNSWVVLGLTFFFVYFGYNPSYQVIQFVSDYGIVLLVNLYFLVIISGALFVYVKKFWKKITSRFGKVNAKSSIVSTTRAISERYPGPKRDEIQLMKNSGTINNRSLFESFLRKSAMPKPNYEL